VLSAYWRAQWQRMTERFGRKAIWLWPQQLDQRQHRPDIHRQTTGNNVLLMSRATPGSQLIYFSLGRQCSTVVHIHIKTATASLPLVSVMKTVIVSTMFYSSPGLTEIDFSSSRLTLTLPSRLMHCAVRLSVCVKYVNCRCLNNIFSHLCWLD